MRMKMIEMLYLNKLGLKEESQRRESCPDIFLKDEYIIEESKEEFPNV